MTGTVELVIQGPWYWQLFFGPQQ